MPIEIRHQDEARVGQQGTPTCVWAEKGSRPAVLRDLRYEWAKLAQGSAGAAGGIASQGCLFDTACAERSAGAALVLPHADTKAMNLHLVEIGRNVTAGAHALVVLDGTGWHQTGGDPRLPVNISLLHLPPCSPELNPVETVWQHLRENQLSNRVHDSYDTIVDACCAAWNALIVLPDRIQSIATRSCTKEVMT